MSSLVGFCCEYSFVILEVQTFTLLHNSMWSAFTVCERLIYNIGLSASGTSPLQMKKKVNVYASVNVIFFSKIIFSVYLHCFFSQIKPKSVQPPSSCITCFQPSFVTYRSWWPVSDDSQHTNPHHVWNLASIRHVEAKYDWSCGTSTSTCFLIKPVHQHTSNRPGIFRVRPGTLKKD